MTPILRRRVLSKALAGAVASAVILGGAVAHAAVFLDTGHGNRFEDCNSTGCYKAQKDWRGHFYDYVFTPYANQNSGGQTGDQGAGNPPTGQGHNDDPQGGLQGASGDGSDGNGDGSQGDHNGSGDPQGSPYTPPTSNDIPDPGDNPGPNSGSNTDPDPNTDTGPNNGGGPVTTAPTPDLAKVPEPDVWGLMLAGLSVVGVAMRRRRTAPAAIDRDISLSPPG